MRTVIKVFLLKTHAVTNKNMSEKITKEKFIADMLNAHKVVLQEAWVKWEDLLDKTNNAEGRIMSLEEEYPNGFYSFFTQYIDILLAENKGDIEKIEDKKITKVANKKKNVKK